MAAVFGGGLLAFAVLFVAVGLDKADQYGSVIGALTAFAMAGVALWQWRTPPPAPGDALDTAAALLAEAVGAQWREEARVRGLWRPEPLRVRWSTTRRPVQAAVPARDLRRRGDGARLAANFRANPARQLVILGGPGAGKTTLTVLLVVELLREPRPGEPVPVLLPLSSWNTRTDVRAWMAERLEEDHAFLTDARAHGPGVAARLIAAGRVMPVLDGLDEVAPARRAAAIEAVERAFSTDPLVLTCRADEYEETVTASNTPISRAPVIELEDVDVEDTIAFLERVDGPSGDRWTPVFARLRADRDGPLAAALSTPLMVDLARTAYTAPGSDPAELLDADRFGERGAIEDHLLDNLVPAVFPEHGRYRRDRARRWLAALARQMWWRGTRDIAPWQLRSGVVALVGGAAAGAGGWLLCGLMFGTTAWQTHLGGVLVGLAGALTAMVGERADAPRDAAADPRSVLRRHLALSGLWTALVGTLVGLLLFVAAGGVGGDSVRARLLGVAFAALFGLSTAVSSSWGAYLVSHGWLALTGRLPLRLHPFLKEAHRRGVLRRAGAVHQFRHARLQDRLAGSPDGPGDGEAPPRLGWWSASLLRIAAPVVALLVAVLVYLTTWPEVSLEAVDGYRPARSTVLVEQNCPNAQGQPEDCSFSQVVHTWRLPPGARTETRFALRDASGSVAFSGLRGHARLDGCPAAVAEIALRVGTNAPQTLRINAGRTPRVLAALSGRWPPETPGFVVTVRRLDAQPCAAEMVWTDVRVTQAVLGYLHRNLRGERS
ncbi:hypothetical protein [Actinomadura flavalba]|uniref:hypothetical protein n=1 Tax=Actinomadura flavalba TaxID=1120938 RepID=UPI00036BBBE8|nr:hypothetical protein [Actinomadura flavalba]